MYHFEVVVTVLVFFVVWAALKLLVEFMFRRMRRKVYTYIGK